MNIILLFIDGSVCIFACEAIDIDIAGTDVKETHAVLKLRARKQ